MLASASEISGAGRARWRTLFGHMRLASLCTVARPALTANQRVCRELVTVRRQPCTAVTVPDLPYKKAVGPSLTRLPRPIGVAWRWPSTALGLAPRTTIAPGQRGSTWREGHLPRARRLVRATGSMLDLPCGLPNPLVVELPVEVGDPAAVSQRARLCALQRERAAGGLDRRGPPTVTIPAVAGAGTRSFAGWPRCLLTRARGRAASDHYTEAWRARLSSRWRRRGHGVAVAHDDEPE